MTVLFGISGEPFTKLVGLLEYFKANATKSLDQIDTEVQAKFKWIKHRNTKDDKGGNEY